MGFPTISFLLTLALIPPIRFSQTAVPRYDVRETRIGDWKDGPFAIGDDRRHLAYDKIDDCGDKTTRFCIVSFISGYSVAVHFTCDDKSQTLYSRRRGRWGERQFDEETRRRLAIGDNELSKPYVLCAMWKPTPG
jgi:hypothetical protein